MAGSYLDAPLFLFARLDHRQLGLFFGKQPKQFLPLRLICFRSNLVAIMLNVETGNELVHWPSMPDPAKRGTNVRKPT